MTTCSAVRTFWPRLVLALVNFTRTSYPPASRCSVAARKSSVYLADFTVDPEVAEIFQAPADGTALSASDVRTRTLEALADEARRMLDEGVVAAPEDLDLAMITGAGFSFWNGGLTQLLDREGVSEKVSGKKFH